MCTHSRKILEEVLSHPGDIRLLNQTKEMREDILECLDSRLLEVDMRKFPNQEWVMRVVTALAESDLREIEAERKRIVDELSPSFEKQEADIGAAFKHGLLPGLSRSLLDFRSWFRSLPTVERKKQEMLLETPVVQAALPESRPLVRFGLSPLTFLEASDAVALLGNRVRRDQDQAKQRSQVILQHDNAIDEVRLFCGFGYDYEPAKLLYYWLIAASDVKPCIFLGHRSEVSPKELILEPLVDKRLDIHKLWSIERYDLHS
jgi:hypothetical protein